MNNRNGLVSVVCLTAILFFNSLQVNAQNMVSAGTARERAQSFIGSGAVADMPVATINDSDGNAALYVFNNSDGGVIIVAADERASHKVLGRTEQGDWNSASKNVAFMGMLESYADGIGRMRHAAASELIACEQAVSAAAESQYPAAVDPLLGEIAWGQDWPYNLMVPFGPDGKNYPTGCVATATAQLMCYYNWPERGQGSNRYYWNGTYLEADFSKSEYKWKQMRPTYSGNEDTESCNAVALLMRDIGIAFEMVYGYYGSGTVFSYSAMYNNFDYDAGFQLLKREYCSTSQWEDVLRSELSQGRPVIVDGGSLTAGGHEFVCDGYDADGYFHYNFGWNGSSNGWLASTATGFDSYPTLTYGIQPDKGGHPQLSLHSSDNFMWVSGDRFSCGLDISFVYQGADCELGIALRNISTGVESVYKTTVLYGTGSTGCSWPINSLDFNQSVPDGSYKMYPVARVIGDDIWRKFSSSELKQSEVDLTVQNGVRTYQNNGLVDPVDPGKVLIDGIYYRLNDNGTAAVTYKNGNYNSYSGNVTIPDNVVWNNVEYSVDSIAENAFTECEELKEVYVGSNVIAIESGAFSGSRMSKIVFAEGSRLQSLGGWAFNGCVLLTDVSLPKGLKRIGMCAFQSCNNLKSVDIPKSTYALSRLAFNGCIRLESVRVHWTDSSVWYNFTDDIFDGCNKSAITLTVPNGMAGIYRSSDLWKDFIIVEDDSPEEPGEEYLDDDPEQLYVLGNDGSWNPSAPSCVLLRTGSKRSYSGLITVSDAGAGYGYFCIGTCLGSNSNDWGTFNANRLGAETSDQQVYIGGSFKLYPGNDASFCAVAGTYAVTICLADMTMTVTDANGVYGIDIDSADGDAVRYDLSGRRISGPYRGLYISGGRKYIGL